MNVIWETLEKGDKSLEETHAALLNAFLPSMKGEIFDSEWEGTE